MPNHERVQRTQVKDPPHRVRGPRVYLGVMAVRVRGPRVYLGVVAVRVRGPRLYLGVVAVRVRGPRVYLGVGAGCPVCLKQPPSAGWVAGVGCSVAIAAGGADCPGGQA